MISLRSQKARPRARLPAAGTGGDADEDADHRRGLRQGQGERTGRAGEQRDDERPRVGVPDEAGVGPRPGDVVEMTIPRPRPTEGQHGDDGDGEGERQHQQAQAARHQRRRRSTRPALRAATALNSGPTTIAPTTSTAESLMTATAARATARTRKTWKDTVGHGAGLWPPPPPTPRSRRRRDDPVPRPRAGRRSRTAFRSASSARCRHGRRARAPPARAALDSVCSRATSTSIRSPAGCRLAPRTSVTLVIPRALHQDVHHAVGEALRRGEAEVDDHGSHATRVHDCSRETRRGRRAVVGLRARLRASRWRIRLARRGGRPISTDRSTSGSPAG